MTSPKSQCELKFNKGYFVAKTKSVCLRGIETNVILQFTTYCEFVSLVIYLNQFTPKCDIRNTLLIMLAFHFGMCATDGYAWIS